MSYDNDNEVMEFTIAVSIDMEARTLSHSLFGTFIITEDNTLVTDNPTCTHENKSFVYSEAPTCTSEGYNLYVCNDCNLEISVIVEKLPHSINDFGFCPECGYTPENENTFYCTDQMYSNTGWKSFTLCDNTLTLTIGGTDDTFPFYYLRSNDIIVFNANGMRIVIKLNYEEEKTAEFATAETMGTEITSLATYRLIDSDTSFEVYGCSDSYFAIAYNFIGCDIPVSLLVNIDFVTGILNVADEMAYHINADGTLYLV
jgi:hypothetical protein